LPPQETVFLEIQIPMKDLIVFTEGQGPDCEEFGKLGHLFCEDCETLLGTASPNDHACPTT